MTFKDLKFLSRENVLALLPIPSEGVAEIDAALDELNQGENGGIVGSIERLMHINKATRFNTKSWGRLKQGASLKSVVSYSFITFDEEEDSGTHLLSFSAFGHTSTQAPMLLVSFDRCSGSRPTNLAEPGNTYVISRYPSGQVILKSGLTAERIASTQLRWT